jgi:hypothetical protein
MWTRGKRVQDKRRMEAGRETRTSLCNSEGDRIKLQELCL